MPAIPHIYDEDITGASAKKDLEFLLYMSKLDYKNFNIKIKKQFKDYLYQQLFISIYESVKNIDILAINGFIESEIIKHINEDDVLKVWELCFNIFPSDDYDKNMILVNFMVNIKRLRKNIYPPVQPARRG